MTDIPEDVMKAAKDALHAAYDEHEVLYPMTNTIFPGLWDRLYEATASAILAERERGDGWKATAAAETGKYQVLATDPNAVHVKMLRGTIAKPSLAQIIHLYGEQVLLDALSAVRVEQRSPMD